VEFADTDAATLIHFTSLFRYMEEAEHAFYRSLGARAVEWTESGFSGMPRVAASCEFLGPLRYGDEVDVRLILREKRSKVLRYDAEFTRVAADGATLIARGSMTVVHAHRTHGDLDWSGAELPVDLLARLEVQEAE
jgi:acyl-CoA thioesterase FadM